MGLHRDWRLAMGPVHAALYHLPTRNVYRVFSPLSGWLHRTLEQGALQQPVPEAAELWYRQSDVLTSDPALMATEPFAASSHEVSPKMVWLEVTQQCNYRCVHCYADSSPECSNHLSDPTLHDLIDEVADGGFGILQFTGGDPTANPRLMDLVRHAHQLDIPVVEVYTNGAHLSEAWLDEMAELGTQIAISFYSHDPQTYEAITQLPGSFAKVVRNIGRILARNIPLRIGLILMEQNKADEEQSRIFLIGLGIPAEKIGSDFVRPVGRGTGLAVEAPAPGRMKPDSGVFPIDKLLNARNKTDSLATSGDWLMPLPATFTPNDRGLPGYNSCWSGELVVASDGEVYPCIFARSRSLGNVKEKGLTAVIGGKATHETWALNLGDSQDCAVCEFRYACFDCRALTESLTGDVHAKPPGCHYDPHSGLVETQRELDVQTCLQTSLQVRTDLQQRNDALYDPVNGHLFQLSAMGRQLMAACDGSVTLGELATEAATLPGAVQGEVERAFAEFAQSLAAAGMLTGTDLVP